MFRSSPARLSLFLTLFPALGCAGVAGAQSLVRGDKPIEALAEPPADAIEGELPAVSALAASAAIPRAFHGRWAGSVPRCATPDDTHAEIAEDAITLRHIKGVPVAIATLAPGDIELTARFAGARDQWDQVQRLTLSPDGRELSVLLRGVRFQRYRCP